MNRLRIYPKKLFWRMFFVSLVVSLILDFLWLYSNVFHYHFSFQYILEFFALFGLFGCMALILIAKGMGIFIVTDEEYYERQSEKLKK
ncbi:MAG: hypothetical protein IMF01_10030 [Proteobacteria bacterium]|jgi:uncharacterized membrane protein|nr:hypothetical protein [Pseudomonadota bacterium]